MEMGPQKNEEISLRYLPIDSCKDDEIDDYIEYDVSDHDPSLSVRSADYFEFVTSDELQSEMCPADDLIVAGKLLPLKRQCASLICPIIQIDGSPIESRQSKDVRCRRSDSSSELKPASTSNIIKTRMARNYSRKSDSSSVSSDSSFVPDLDSNCSWKSDTSSEGSPKMRNPSWQSLIFGIGMVKLPLKMELTDIKNRQSRRSCTASIFPGTPVSEAKSPINRRFQGRGTSWGLITALSCKDHRCTSVNTSFVRVPHI